MPAQPKKKRTSPKTRFLVKSEKWDSTAATQTLKLAAAVPVHPTCYISKLPDELLAEIMVHAGGKACRFSWDWSSPSTLVAVCKRWRSIAIATPQLWRCLRIRSKRPGVSKQRLSLWTERSASAVEARGVIDIALEQAEGFREEFKQLITTWASSPRWNSPKKTLMAELRPSLTLYHTEVTTAMDCLALAPQQLGLLRLHGSTGTIFDYAVIANAITQRGIGHLETLSLHSVRFPKDITHLPSLSSVTRIFFTKLDLPNAADSAIALFEQLPNLREAEISFGNVQNSVAIKTSPIVMPCLERAEFLWPPTNLFRRILAPKLKVLRVCPRFGNEEVLESLEEHWKPYTTLPLQQLHLDGGNTRSCSKVFPRLVAKLENLEALVLRSELGDVDVVAQSLTIERSLSDSVEGSTIFPHSSSAIPCPKLRIVDFRDCKMLTGRALRRMIASRMPAFSILPENLPCTPIHTLVIDKYSQVGETDLEWLSKTVPCIREEAVFPWYRRAWEDE